MRRVRPGRELRRGVRWSLGEGELPLFRRGFAGGDREDFALGKGRGPRRLD